MGQPVEAGDDSEELCSEKAGLSVKASGLATFLYVFVAFGHLGLLAWHYQSTTSTGGLFIFLAVMEGILGFESLVYAAGAFGTAATFKPLITMGRVQKLSQAIAWPWLLPWVTELGCRAGASERVAASLWWHHMVQVAAVISAFYLLREFSFAFKGEPVSALNTNVEANFGDCLPSQAIMGGQFRLDKKALETTGRALFVPARERWGLFIGSGLAVLSHLINGVRMSAHVGGLSWLFVGVLLALAGRRSDPLFKTSGVLWTNEGPRLLSRIGELAWLACCIFELRRWESTPGWLESC